MKFLFYNKIGETQSIENNGLPVGYSIEIWHPNNFSIKPKSLPTFPFFIWWLFHHFGIFTNSRYSIYSVSKDGRLVHRSCVFPKYFRFSFMGADDLQVGDIWTEASERGKGLASYVLNKIVSDHSNTRIWYITEENNISSMRVVTKAGFSLAGGGLRIKRYGLYLLGSYQLQAGTVHD